MRELLAYEQSELGTSRSYSYPLPPHAQVAHIYPGSSLTRRETKRWTPPKGRTYQELMREMLALCTGVVEDAEALMAIFEDAEVKQEQVDLAGD